MTDLLKNPIFQDETAARDWLEARVWTNGRVCPHCGNADQDKLTKLEGKAHRPGLYPGAADHCDRGVRVRLGAQHVARPVPELHQA